MKKIFAIALLAVALLAGGMTVEAKTIKKIAKTSQSRKSPSSSLKVNSFMKNSGRGYELTSLKQIRSILTSKGFKYIGSEYTQVSELDADGYIFKDSKGTEVTVVAITDSNVGVVDDVIEITFRFINAAERDKFTKGLNGNIYGAGDQVQIVVDGNTVIMIDDCYYC